jgi:endosialidase-like protein
MRNKARQILWLGVLGMFLVWIPLAAEELRSPEPSLARLNISASELDWFPLGDYESLVLTIAGPKDLYFHKEFQPGESASLGLFDATGKPLPDGDYTYEVRLTSPAGERPRLQAGSFVVREGSFVAPFDLSKAPTDKKSATMPQIKNVTAAATISEALCVGPLCEDPYTGPPLLKLKDYYNVGIKFEDVFDGFSYYRDWLLQANPNLGGPDSFFLQDLDANTFPFSVYGNSPDYSLVVGTGGKIGLGTATPGAPLHLYSSATGDAFAGMGPDPASGPAFNLGYGGASFGRGAGFLNVRPDASATAPNPSLRFLTANVERMIITNTGSVGIGTNSPSNKLHVEVNTPGQGVFINGGTANSVNVIAQGNAAGIVLNDLNGGTNQKIAQQFVDSAAWRLRGINDAATTETVPGIILSLADGNVGINCHVSPGADLVVDDGGSCNVGTRSELNAGATQFTVPSSRSLKENLAPVEVEGILDRIRRVKVYSYDFIDGPKDRIGLIAEDFHAIFARGSDKTISGDEIQLAMWLAIQELSAQNEALLRKVEELSQRP